jgi:hypothetical protein
VEVVKGDATHIVDILHAIRQFRASPTWLSRRRTLKTYTSS